MPITHQILGKPGRDNCLLVNIDTGQSLARLLFDCGADCLGQLPVSETQAIDHLFFSHLHMDHVAGFDDFFRLNYNRQSKANAVWGPPETSRILQHRFQGFWWNLHADQAATWQVNEISPEAIYPAQFELREAFAIRHTDVERIRGDVVLDARGFTVDALQLQHKGPSIGYLVREKPRRNVDVEKLSELGLSPGPWLEQLKGDAPDDSPLDISGAPHRLGDIRSQLLTERDGESIAYLTDFVLDESSHEQLANWLRGCDTLICEAQYCHDDAELAAKHAHTTTKQVGRLADDAKVGQLVLFHLSDRYRPPQWREMRDEAADQFPNTRYAPQWRLD